MERIALISDIHGNLPALEAALYDIRSRQIERIICLGDLVGKGPSSAQVVDLCREVCQVILKGNWDDFTAQESTIPAVLWRQQQLGRERMDFLRQLSHTHELLMSGRRVRLFHASPTGLYDRVFMNDDPKKQLAMFTNTEFTGYGMEPDVVGYGDIHRAYLKTYQDRILFNVGSVGNPLDTTRAAYAILEGSEQSHLAAPFSIQIVRLPYDIERAIQQAEEVQMPDLAEYRSELRTARYRGLS
jgi:protein phosphatase